MILNRVKTFSFTISLTLLVFTSVLKLTKLLVNLSSTSLLVSPRLISGLYLLIFSFISTPSFLFNNNINLYIYKLLNACYNKGKEGGIYENFY